jgi:hypothetical protein
LFFLVLFLIFSFLTLTALAQTGLVQIPFFSSLFYQLPKPKRVVEINNLSDLAGKSFNLEPSVDQKTAALTITEEELTFLLRQTLASGSDPFFAPNIQATISHEEIEFFGLLLRPLSANITLKLIPRVVDGRLKLLIRQVLIGQFSAPPQIAGWLVKKFLGDNLSLDKVGSLVSGARLSRVELSPANLILIFSAINK